MKDSKKDDKYAFYQYILDGKIYIPKGWYQIRKRIFPEQIKFACQSVFLDDHKILISVGTNIIRQISWMIFLIPSTIFGILAESWNWGAVCILFVLASILRILIEPMYISRASDRVVDTYIYHPDKMQIKLEKSFPEFSQGDLDFQYKRALHLINRYFYIMASFTSILPFAFLMYIHPIYSVELGVTGIFTLCTGIYFWSFCIPFLETENE